MLVSSTDLWILRWSPQSLTREPYIVPGAEVSVLGVANLLHNERIRGELVAVRLLRRGEISVGAAGPRRFAASGDRWFLKFLWLQRENALTTGC
jgi:hypothetical protein